MTADQLRGHSMRQLLSAGTVIALVWLSVLAASAQQREGFLIGVSGSCVAFGIDRRDYKSCNGGVLHMNTNGRTSFTVQRTMDNGAEVVLSFSGGRDAQPQ